MLWIRSLLHYTKAISQRSKPARSINLENRQIERFVNSERFDKTEDPVNHLGTSGKNDWMI